MEKHINKYSKYCLVPQCSSTSVRTPGKIFISLPVASNPLSSKKRKLWLRAMRRNENDLSSKTRGFVCEDHFDLEKDMVNYIKYKLVGGNIYLKEHVVPHNFECQATRVRSLQMSERTSSVQRTRKGIVNKLLCDDASSGNSCSKLEVDTIVTEVSTLPSTQQMFPESQLQPLPHSEDKGVQTLTICQRTVSLQQRPFYRSKFVQTDSSQNVVMVDTSCSPFKCEKICSVSPSKFSENSISDNTSESGFAVALNDTDLSSSTCSTVDNFENERIRAMSIERSLFLAKSKPRFYLGIPEDSYFVVDLILKCTKCKLVDIYLTLKKIRTNLPFEHLGDDFGVSASQAAKIFNRSVPQLSACLKQLICWPSKDKIKRELPLAFRANYYNVQSIIDCFEIEIEKPSDPVKQSCTWSEYKKTNTIKYLISSTPDGLITFVSQGFGGRTSDVVIVKDSDYLKMLPNHCSVMADRGFKRIDILLQPLTCTLIRPPSVKRGLKSTKAEVLETKKIAALRIHIERVIRRVREFKLLKPHACINNKLIKYLDHIIIIVCALINLQSGIIKK